MSNLYRVDVPVNTASGEFAQWSHWLIADTDALALAGGNGYMVNLAASVPFRSSFPVLHVFGPCKISRVDLLTGHVLSTQFGTSTFTGNAGTTTIPPQCAVVVTLRTLTAGASNRGRYYLPSLASAALTATGRIPTATVTSLLAALKSAHDIEIAVPATPSVYSRKLHAAQAITTIEIGDVYDTQRRRRDKLIEARQSSTL